MLIGCFVCKQNHAKTTKWISVKLGGRNGNGPKKNPLKFGVDPVKEKDPGILILKGML